MPEEDSTTAFLASVAEKIKQGGLEALAANDLQQLCHLFNDQNNSNQSSKSIPYLDRKFLWQNTHNNSNNNNIKTPKLVRHVGMVQNMLPVEFYQHHQEDFEKFSDRQPLILVPLPCVSDWFHPSRTANQQQPNDGKDDNNNHQNKRMREPDAQVLRSVSKPRISHNNDSSMVVDEDDLRHSDTAANATKCNATNNDASSNQDWWPAGCLQSHANECPVLARLYYDVYQQQNLQGSKTVLHLNDVVECIGVLTVGEEDLAKCHDDHCPRDVSMQDHPWDDEMHMDGDGGGLPTPILLPRLDVVMYRTLDLDQQVLRQQLQTKQPDMMPQQQQDERSSMIELLSQQVFSSNSSNNKVAAEALLLTLLSMAERQPLDNIPIKTPQETTLGCASLQLTCTSSETSCLRLRKRLERILGDVLPVLRTVDVSRDTLNNHSVVLPGKTHTQRMNESVLQLPRGSTLLLHVSNLTEGPVTARAQATLQVLSSLTGQHSIPYTFEGNLFPFEADYRVIVVSRSAGVNRGRRSTTGTSSGGNKLLPCTLQMNVEFDYDNDDERMAPVMPTEAAERLCTYLARCRCPNPSANDSNNNIALSKEVLECAQHDFVQRRVAHRNNHAEQEVGEEDFHRWLTLTRLFARSRGQRTAEVKDWNDALRLDDAMRSFPVGTG